MANFYTIYSSPDEGANWSLIKNDVEGYFPCGVESATGRIWVFYYRTDKLYYTYSDDGGENWNGEAEVVLEEGDPPEEVVPAEGKVGLAIAPTGRLYVNFWSEDVIRYAYSDDGAGTWTVGTVA